MLGNISTETHVAGAPRKVIHPRLGYAWALPLSAVPPPGWTDLFVQAWDAQPAMYPAMKHPPMVDDEWQEILLNIDLSDKEAAQAALDKVASLVDDCTRQFNDREAWARDQAQSGKEAWDAQIAEAEAFFQAWWSERQQRQEGATRS
jgi:hypothetical protein